MIDFEAEPQSVTAESLATAARRRAALLIHGADAERFFDTHTIRDSETGELKVNPEEPLTGEVGRRYATHIAALDEADCQDLRIHGIHGDDDRVQIRHDIALFAVVLDVYTKLEPVTEA
jgi:hypothetical protein